MRLKKSAACIIAFILCASELSANPITATITADNHYALYYGTDSSLTYWGRNEFGAFGSPGVYNWSVPETFDNLNPADSDRFYIAQWDSIPNQGATTQALLAEFLFGGSVALRTNTAQWEYYLTSIPNLGELGEAPTTDAMQTALTSSLWTVPAYNTPNGTGVWAGYSSGMPIPGISTAAHWISRTGQEDSSYFLTVYRSVPIGTVESAPVPEPTTLALLGIGLACLGYQRRRDLI